MIGTNKKDATETVQLLLADAAAGLLGHVSEVTRWSNCCEARDVEAVLYAGWEAIDLAERTAGEPHGRPRIKLATWDELLSAGCGKQRRASPPRVVLTAIPHSRDTAAAPASRNT